MDEEILEVTCEDSGTTASGTLDDLDADGWNCINGDWYSDGHWFDCEHCNQPKPESRRNTTDSDSDICIRCADRYFYQCNDCDGLVHADDAIHLSNGVYHPDCAPVHHWCEQVDEYVEGYDDDCRRCNTGRLLLNYSTKFHDLDGLTFHSGTNATSHRAERRIGYYGLEIESAHRDGDWQDGAEYFWDMFGRDYDQAVIKEDGSLHERGYELVTQPRTLESYENWSQLWTHIDWMRNQGFEGWKPLDRYGDRIRAGIHIHVSRTAFTNRAHVARFIKSVYMWREQMKKFSGRNSPQYADYSDYEEREFINRAKGESNSNRMVAVNCQNTATIELRIFRSSLRVLTIKAYIEMTDALLEWSRQMDCAKQYRGEFCFTNFVAWLGDKPRYANALERINARVLLTPDES